MQKKNTFLLSINNFMESNTLSILRKTPNSSYTILFHPTKYILEDTIVFHP